MRKATGSNKRKHHSTRPKGGKRRDTKHRKKGNGVRVGYHSEAANPPKTDHVEGMKMGYHSEAANPPKGKPKEEGGGMRMGYHSERANPPKTDHVEGMKMGYHSEAANPPKVKEAEEDGMNKGYHSEAANIGSHSKRLHEKKRSREQNTEDNNSMS